MAELTPRDLNHIANPTWDTGATYRFYTEVLGCELVAAVEEDRVPSTGAPDAFLHTFFQMSTGECIAFFEVEDLPPAGDDGVPDWIRHIALNVDSREELAAWQEHLDEHGVEYRGPVDHEGIWQSIYFFDPNGIRLELTYQTEDLDDEHAEEAQSLVERWTAEKGQTLTAAG